MSVGDVLVTDGCEYKTIRKLALGMESSVWLVERISSRYGLEVNSLLVAKILTGEASVRAEAGETAELALHMALRKLHMALDEKAGRMSFRHTIGLCDNGERGGFHFFVFLPHAATLYDICRGFKNCDLHRDLLLVKRVIKQSIRGLIDIHQLGFIHTGQRALFVRHVFDGLPVDLVRLDIKADNLSVPLYADSKEGLRAFLEHRTPPLTKECEVPNIRVQLGDFSSVIKAPRDTTGVKAMPRPVRAPEIILGRLWGQAIDVWALGCLAMELLLPSLLFFPKHGYDESEYGDYSHLAQMIELLGPFSVSSIAKCPENVRSRFFRPDGSLKPADQFLAESFARCPEELRSEIFHSNGSLRHPDVMKLPRPGTLQQLLRNARLRGAELDEVHAFVGRMLTLDPDYRPTAAQLLEFPLVAKFNMQTNGTIDA
ncbi:kinase-like domain-containing protein [Epithele typhae]|uniref:kinase-like domain-containing protein n=1 Tax=Epithele typhae TaxID=378194 RepID=UPI00200785A8|nr:kinase-like domain-containing protein [Epithele typhae]KAH9939725.1 kinase-like domain-containing protein [Epithele typhae]